VINQLTQPYPFSDNEKTCIEAAGFNWDSQTNCIKQIKVDLNEYFDTVQDEKCCYCGLKYNETGRGEIDHIAPKGEEEYEKLSYHRRNIAKACQLCNSSTMKHTYDPITERNPVYKKNKFEFVHPYLDDPSEHYAWRHGVKTITISIRDDSTKAAKSIEVFELDSEARTSARAKQRNHEFLVQAWGLPKATLDRIKQAISKGYSA